jgi:hypothetical protein
MKAIDNSQHAMVIDSFNEYLGIVIFEELFQSVVVEELIVGCYLLWCFTCICFHLL